MQRTNSLAGRALLVMALVSAPRVASCQGPASIDTAGAIREARATFQEAGRAVAARRWIRTDTTVRCGDEEAGDDITMDRDSAGTIRRLRWSGGTADHAETHSYFYDAMGRLRFAYVTLGAVNGTQSEERVYFTGAGDVVRRVRRLVRGPGYPSDPVVGVRDPEAWLRGFCH